MRAKLRSWRQKNKQLLIIATVIILALLLVFALAVYLFGWDWTGFTSGLSKITKTSHGTTTEYSPGKNLWDWMQLLLIPILLVIGGFWLNQIQKVRDQKAEEAQKLREADAAKEREKLERESREDNQRETALQAYIDKMSELLLTQDLRKSAGWSAEDKTPVFAHIDEVRNIARVRTLTVLSRLDKERTASVLQFLYESGLIDKNKRIIDLSGADLIGVDYSGFGTRISKFSDADQYEINLRHVDLSGTILIGANFEGVKFVGAKLTGAELSLADLSGADLSDADLSGAYLIGANLSDANLKDAIGITTEELEKQAESLKGATMPDGSKHP